MNRVAKFIAIVLVIGFIIKLLPILAFIALILAIFYAVFRKNLNIALLACLVSFLFFVASSTLSNHQQATSSSSQEMLLESNQTSSNKEAKSSSSKTNYKREGTGKENEAKPQLTNVSSNQSQGHSSSKTDSKPIISEETAQTQENGTLAFTKQKQLLLKPLDDLGRASLAHIQLQNSHEPEIKRDQRIDYNPVGWKNFNFYYLDGSKKAWLMNRGHLVGYQFSGLDEIPENLVPMTAWLNTGNYSGMNSSNTDSMLFYENQLDNWLSNHPNYWLDYQVRAIYEGDDLWPKQIELQYVGLDESGKLQPIQLDTPKETTDTYGVTRVILDNISPNATIDYTKGIAKGSVESAEVQERARQAQAEQAASQQVPSDSSTQTATDTAVPANPETDDPIVYVTGGGKSEVYWYSTANMPHNTNLNNLVQMPRSQAEALGKRHSLSE